MFSKLTTVFLVACSLLFTPRAAFAYDWYVAAGHLYYVEATYMPTVIPFRIAEAASPSCPANTQLTYNATSTDNGKAVFAALLAARATNTPVRLFGINPGCVVQFVSFG